MRLELLQQLRCEMGPVTRHDVALRQAAQPGQLALGELPCGGNALFAKLQVSG
jgi:hypothetical protein